MSIAPGEPKNWPAAHRSAVAAPPEIQAIRFSSLQPRLGGTWDGDVLASTNTASVEVRTKMFSFEVPRVQPGRFHFHYDLTDLPATMVRRYDLQIVARNEDGRERRVRVPFRIEGRNDTTAYNANARSSDALSAPPLVDMNGAPVDLMHGVTVVSFIYTRCPDPSMCPLVTAKFARMSKLLADTRVKLLEITLDPAFDTPAVLRTYGHSFGADGVRWTLATGERRSIVDFAERSGISVERPRPGLVLHTEAVLIARDGFLENSFAGNDWTAGDVAAEARAIASLPANPLARLALRLFAGAVRTCGAVVARGLSPALLLACVATLLAASGLVFTLRRRSLRGATGPG